MYEISIVCNKCGCLKSQGGFLSMPVVSRHWILDAARHNPGCIYLQDTVNIDSIKIDTVLDDDTVTKYVIS